MIYVMRVFNYADGTPFDAYASFLRSFDFEALEGLGDGTFTRDVRLAKQFASQDEALMFWHTRSRTLPKRDDGKPNRPLTAWSIEVAPLSDFTAAEAKDG